MFVPFPVCMFYIVMLAFFWLLVELNFFESYESKTRLYLGYRTSQEIYYVHNSCRVSKLQKRIMSGAEPRVSCRVLFRKLETLPVPCHYILSLMLFIMDNPNNFQTGLEIHGLHTRIKNQLFIPIANLTSVQKGINYPDIKIYNCLPSNILNLANDKKQF